MGMVWCPTRLATDDHTQYTENVPQLIYSLLFGLEDRNNYFKSSSSRNLLSR